MCNVPSNKSKYFTNIVIMIFFNAFIKFEKKLNVFNYFFLHLLYTDMFCSIGNMLEEHL